MNQKEVGELRRRFQPEKSTVRRIYGCYVNNTGEIVAYLDESIGTMPAEEAEQYLGLLKKSLSGTVGKNLIDIVFSTRQVMDSDEHRLLCALRNSELRDEAAREAFYQTVIRAMDLDGSYVILLAHNVYDVPGRGKGADPFAAGGDEVFSFIVCCVCPLKEGKASLSFCPAENEFHSRVPGPTVCPPELGFLFPAFDDRAANIYSALFYSRRPNALHQSFLDAVFRVEPPMTAGEQKEAFQAALSESLENACSLAVVQSVYGQLQERIEQHKESKDPEPLLLSAREMGEILQESGVEEPQVTAFCETCEQQFGDGVALSPANLIDSKRFAVKTAEATLLLNAVDSGLVEVRVVDGRRYLLIPVGEGLEVNGIPVH